MAIRVQKLINEKNRKKDKGNFDWMDKLWIDCQIIAKETVKINRTKDFIVIHFKKV